MSTEETAPYGSGPAKTEAAAPPKRVRTHHLREMKQRGEKFAMLTAYEQYAAQTFDEAGIEVLSADAPLLAENLVPVTDAAEARAVLRIIVALEDNDDVQDVFSNFDIPDDLMELVSA